MAHGIGPPGCCCTCDSSRRRLVVRRLRRPRLRHRLGPEEGGPEGVEEADGEEEVGGREGIERTDARTGDGLTDKLLDASVTRPVGPLVFLSFL